MNRSRSSAPSYSTAPAAFAGVVRAVVAVPGEPSGGARSALISAAASSSFSSSSPSATRSRADGDVPATTTTGTGSSSSSTSMSVARVSAADTTYVDALTGAPVALPPGTQCVRGRWLFTPAGSALAVEAAEQKTVSGSSFLVQLITRLRMGLSALFFI